jgi:uncharacterized protein YlxP (DUF503 family)
VLVALERFDLRIPGCIPRRSATVKTLTAALRQSFPASVAEVDHDLRQRTTIAVAVVGADQYHVRRVMQSIERRVDAWVEVEVIDRELQVLYPED